MTNESGRDGCLICVTNLAMRRSRDGCQICVTNLAMRRGTNRRSRSERVIIFRGVVQVFSFRDVGPGIR